MMSGHYDAYRFWVEVAAFAINAVVWLYVWRVRSNMATNTKILEVEEIIKENVAETSVRLARVDERLRNAIGHTELKPMYDRLNSMDRQLANMAGKMHTLDLIHEMLLNEGKNNG